MKLIHHFYSLLALVMFTALFFACNSNIEVKPVCTVQIEVSKMDTSNWNNWRLNSRIFIADRDDPNVGGHFSPFRAGRGPLSNPAIANPAVIPDCYGISEAWLRIPGNHKIHRAILTDGIARNSNPSGDEWQLHVQDAKGVWQRTLSEETSISRETKYPDYAKPQLMSIGENDPHIFVAVSGMTENGVHRTTWLLESLSPGASPSIHFPPQDLLYGDDFFVPHSAPLVGASPPNPTVSGAGGQGFVNCAMTQLGDDISTRQVHLLAKGGTSISYATASDFGPTINPSNANRFRNVSRWVDLSNFIGGNFGEIIDLAAVGQGNALIVVFIAKKDGKYKIWLTARFSSGSWRAPVDVFAASGDAPNGTVQEINKIAIGTCPRFGADPTENPKSELLIAFVFPSNGGVFTISQASTPQVWEGGNNPSYYSPWRIIRNGAVGTNFIIMGVHVSSRPFSDTK